MVNRLKKLCSFLNNNLLLRVISTLVLSPIVIFAVYNGGILYFLLTLLVGLLACFELMQLQYLINKINKKQDESSNYEVRGDSIKQLKVPLNVDESVVHNNNLYNESSNKGKSSGNNLHNNLHQRVKALNFEGYLLGIVYVLLFVWAMISLKARNDGVIVVSWVLLTVWSSDIFAYIFGTIVRGPKIVPKISPNKTYAGFLGAMIGGLFISIMLQRFIEENVDVSNILLLGVVISVVSQLGDFALSYIKRRARVKDSGTLIPGHGGILDRIDGLMPSVILLNFIL